jgi:hypothetical protein
MGRVLIGLMVIFAVVFAASALGAGNTPSNDVYQSAGPKTQQAVNTPPASGTLGASKESSKPGSELPFTGLDLTFVVGAGVVLVAMGFSLRRLTRKPPS